MDEPRYKRTKTIELLKEFTYVALSEVCKPAYEEKLAKRNKWIPKPLRNAWPFKAKPYNEQGLFAKKDISEGTYLGTYGISLNADIKPADLTPHEEKYIIRGIDPNVKKVISAKPDNNLKFANHSENFNMVVQGYFEFYTSRDVKKDEELTWNYGEFFGMSV